MSDGRMERMRRAFECGTPPESEVDPLVPRFALVDEKTGHLLCRFALDREYKSGEDIILPSLKVKMP